MTTNRSEHKAYVLFFSATFILTIFNFDKYLASSTPCTSKTNGGVGVFSVIVARFNETFSKTLD